MSPRCFGSRRALLGAATILGLGAAAYANALPNAFVWDDEEQIVNNPFLREDARVLPRLLTSSTFQSGGGPLSGAFYRPLVSLSYWVNYHLWGLRPWGFRLFQWMLHLATAILLWRLVSRLAAAGQVPHADQAGWLAALVFTVHPAHVESVIYPANLSEVLVGLFTVSACLCALTGPEGPRGALRPARLWLAIGLGFLGLLSKESAVALFILIGWSLALFTKPTRSTWAQYGAGAVAAVGTYGVLRFGVAHIGLSAVHIAPIAQAALWERLLTVPYELWMQLTTIVFPAYLGIYHHAVIRSAADIRFWGPLAILSVLTIAGWRLIRTPWPSAQARLAIFGAGWFLIAIVPTLNLIPLDMTVAERWLYVPSMGALGLLSGLIVAGRSRLGPRGRRLAGAAIAAGLLALCGRTVLRNRDWRDGLTLYGHDIRSQPNNANLANNYGVELYRAGRHAEALGYLTRSVALEDGWHISHNNLGAALERHGHLEEARREYQRALGLADYYLAYENLAGLLIRLGRQEEARRFIEEALQKLPGNARLRALRDNLTP